MFYGGTCRFRCRGVASGEMTALVMLHSSRRFFLISELVVQDLSHASSRRKSARILISRSCYRVSTSSTDAMVRKLYITFLRGEQSLTILAIDAARVIIDVSCHNTELVKLHTDSLATGDGKQPICGRCENSKKECIYENGRRFRRSSISEAFSDTQPWVSFPPRSKLLFTPAVVLIDNSGSSIPR